MKKGIKGANTYAAPPDIEGLRALSIAIARGESSIYLGSKTQRVLSKLIELQGDQSLLSISSIAEKLDVNPSTISRLARSLGYKRFGDLQKVLIQPRTYAPSDFYRHQAGKALDADKYHLIAESHALTQEHKRNIDLAQGLIKTQDFEKLSSTIMGARHVRLHAIRQFHAFTSFMNYGLGMIHDDVSLLCDASLNVAERLATMTEQDVLITASCKPYSRHVAEVCKVAKSHKITTIAFTDYASSPLVTHSDIAVLVPHDSRFISNSMVAYISIAECLINACATTAGSEAEHELAQRDQLIDDLNIEQP
ncbi:MurR/RpiR family transcriptional regulator [Halomonas sp. ML-15]|uniref:MurR/RpiR family transcriptional regulator n=1 Tax=Halomonas sp. ML-15 TaxID=2773305 RepID=UPI0017464F8E|nr:MurR/RpiR family transcriptional regulator [Halomonas sp. ML-15]MBD3898067.1 MurR/RpiR family transcriptional regulator [Halomonas sp. ML-15]